MSTPQFIAIGSILIDDIVYPDGRSSMGVLGGGGAHAAYGMAFAGERPGLVGLVGQDLPPDIRARLERDFDTAGLAWTHHPQARGWQIFEWSGVRNEIFRVDVIKPFMIHPPADSAGLPFVNIRGLTLLREAQYVQGWRRRFPGATLLWEPTRAFMLAGDRAAFAAGAFDADIVSPNLHEAQSMYGVDDEVEIMRRLLADGVKIAALRMGERGSLIAQRGQSHARFIPAVDVADVVDQTGAGNTYCGGFVVGLCRTGDLAEAGCHAAAAASFSLEHVGCAPIPGDLDREWPRRLADARAGVRSVQL